MKKIGTRVFLNLTIIFLFQILELSGLKATSFRIGQISGGLSNGAWATSDWVPILVKSAINMNALPTATGVGSNELYLFEHSLIAYLLI